MHMMMLILVHYELPGGKRAARKSECSGVRCDCQRKSKSDQLPESES